MLLQKIDKGVKVADHGTKGVARGEHESAGRRVQMDVHLGADEDEGVAIAGRLVNSRAADGGHAGLAAASG